MKIAALYDIHGNLPALNALLEELKEVQPDMIVVGGDIISGPMPGQTLKRLSQFAAQMRSIRGNADREVVMMFDSQPFNRRYMPAPSEKEREVMRWVAEQLTPSQRDFLAELPEQLEVQVEGLGRVLFCHATVRNDEELFTPITPEKQLSIIFSNIEQEIVVCGHTHIQFELRVGNRLILNAGSVGMPYADQPGAYWLLLSPEGYEFRCTTYDGEAAAQEILASGYPQAQEFAENNVLKMPTSAEATAHFERLAQEYWSQEG
ncbi:MAG: metallophosphoesterase family protein [Ktedonobacteraceae bacterium]|nr:metallophosphoesterase family protein [Ktedonobacteraceae bacterium]